jgi:hypothetical protein
MMRKAQCINIMTSFMKIIKEITLPYPGAHAGSMYKDNTRFARR